MHKYIGNGASYGKIFCGYNVTIFLCYLNLVGGYRKRNLHIHKMGGSCNSTLLDTSGWKKKGVKL